MTADIEFVRLNALIEELALKEKILLLAGRDFWTTHPMEKIGLRSILVSDGPIGVRGESGMNVRSHDFSSATAL